MTQRDAGDDDRHFEEALDLLIRLQNDPDNEVTRNLILHWRSRSSAHEEAWAEAEDLHGMSGKILRDRKATASTGISRRKLLAGGSAAAVLVGTGAILGPDLMLRFRSDHMTDTGELRDITLSDRSRVTLGPDSAIRARFSPDLREISLLAGMAFLDVAEDGRPCRVSAADVAATAASASFEISMDAGTVTVAAERGALEIALPGSPAPVTETLPLGERLTFDAARGTFERAANLPADIAAWREGRLVADRDSVAVVVARIARWLPGRVIVADPALADARISGVFNLDAPIAALDSVVRPHGARVRQLSPWITILSPV